MLSTNLVLTPNPSPARVNLYDSVPDDVRHNLDLTCERFGIMNKESKAFMGDALLKFGRVFGKRNYTPTDRRSKSLAQMYKYFVQLCEKNEQTQVEHRHPKRAYAASR